MNIALDIDGVIYPWHYSVYRFFCETKGYSGTQYEFWKFFITLSGEEHDYYINLPFLYNDTTPHEDVLNTLPKLAELGTIFYITSRPESIEHITRKFLDSYEMPFRENLVFTKDKPTNLRLLAIDYFVDDFPKHIESAKGLSKCYLFKQPHNRDRQEEFECVSTLREFYEKIVHNELHTRLNTIVKELGYANI